MFRSVKALVALIAVLAPFWTWARCEWALHDPEMAAILSATELENFQRDPRARPGRHDELALRDRADPQYRLVEIGDSHVGQFQGWLDELVEDTPSRIFPVLLLSGKYYGVVPAGLGDSESDRFVRIWDYLIDERQEFDADLHASIASLAEELEIDEVWALFNFFIDRRTGQAYFCPHRSYERGNLPLFVGVEAEGFRIGFPLSREVTLNGRTYLIERNLAELPDINTVLHSKVFVVRDPETDERLVLKYVTHPTRMPYLRNEIEMLRRVEDPAESELIDSIVSSEVTAVLLRFHDGKNLKAHPLALARESGEELSGDEMDRFLGLARALIAETVRHHQQGIVHGDLKGQNILSWESGGFDVVKFIDYESAFAVVDEGNFGAGPEGRLLNGREVLYSYMPPEIPSEFGGVPLSEGSYNRDWWSLGQTLKKMLLPNFEETTEIRGMSEETYELISALEEPTDEARMRALIAWMDCYWPEGPEIPPTPLEVVPLH